MVFILSCMNSESLWNHPEKGHSSVTTTFAIISKFLQLEAQLYQWEVFFIRLHYSWERNYASYHSAAFITRRERRCHKQFGRGRALSRNACQMIGRNICLSASNTGEHWPIRSTVGEHSQLMSSVNLAFTKVSVKKNKSVSSIQYRLVPGKMQMHFSNSYNSSFLWTYS